MFRGVHLNLMESLQLFEKAIDKSLRSCNGINGDHCFEIKIRFQNTETTWYIKEKSSAAINPIQLLLDQLKQYKL